MSAMRKFIVEVDKVSIDTEMFTKYVFDKKLYINTVKISAIIPMNDTYCIELGSEDYFVNVSKESGDKVISVMGLCQ